VIPLELEDESDDDEVGDLPDDEPDKDGKKPDDKPADKPKDDSKKEKTIPLSAFKKEQARLKTIISDLKSGKSETKDAGKVNRQALIDAGFDEATADTIVGVYGKSASTEKLVNAKFRDMEFKELKKEFPDIEDYRDELEEYAESKGVSVEEAYMAKYGRSRLKANRADIEREVEQRLLEKFKKNGSMKFDTSDNGETTQKGSKNGLTSDQKEAAKFLGMSEREYALFSKGKSFETFEKHAKKKG
jgi:hypothetical protein